MVFVDRKVAPGTAITVAIDDLSGQVTDVGPSRPARFAFAARFLADKARNLSLSGTFGPPPSGAPVGETPLEAEVGAQNVALARLASYVSAFAVSDPGLFNLTGRVSGKLLGALALSGRIALDPPADARLPAVDGTFTASLDWTRGSFSLARSVFDVAELPIALEGRVDDLHGTPRVDLRAGTPGEVGLDHVTGLPGLAGRFPAGWKLGGRIRVDVQIQGAVSALDVRGAADASELAVSRDGKPMFEAASLHATVDARGPETLAGRLTAPARRVRRRALPEPARRLDLDEGRPHARADRRRFRRHAHRARRHGLFEAEVRVPAFARRAGRAGAAARRSGDLGAQRPRRHARRQDLPDEPGLRRGTPSRSPAAAKGDCRSRTPISGRFS